MSILTNIMTEHKIRKNSIKRDDRVNEPKKNGKHIIIRDKGTEILTMQ